MYILEPHLLNDIPNNDSEADDNSNSQTNSELTIEATVLDEGGAGIENVPVNFTNETETDGNGSYGILTSSQVLTNNLGQATTTLVDIDTDNIGDASSISLQIKAAVYDESGEPVLIQEDNWGDCGDSINFDCPDGSYDGATDVNLTLSQTDTATLIPQSQNNIDEVSDLDVWFVQELNLEYNVNVTFNDEISAKVVDSNNTPIEGVPL